MNRQIRTILFCLLISPAICSSADQVDESVDLDQISWLAGYWKGDGFGGTSEEIWSLPANNIMMGMFRLHNEAGELVFYEFMTIDKDGLKLKHFNPDMTGWETKDDYLTFKIVSLSAKRLAFKGLVFELVTDTKMEISLAMKSEGTSKTAVFHMTRFESKE